jgi:hypothetical protein
VSSTQPEPEDDAALPFGYVYLARMGKYYKIGHTSSVGRRDELPLQDVKAFRRRRFM